MTRPPILIPAAAFAALAAATMLAALCVLGLAFR